MSESARSSYQRSLPARHSSHPNACQLRVYIPSAGSKQQASCRFSCDSCSSLAFGTLLSSMRPVCKRCIGWDWRIRPNRKSIQLVSMLKLGREPGWDLRMPFLSWDGILKGVINLLWSRWMVLAASANWVVDMLCNPNHVDLPLGSPFETSPLVWLKWAVGFVSSIAASKNHSFLRDNSPKSIPGWVCQVGE